MRNMRPLAKGYICIVVALGAMVFLWGLTSQLLDPANWLALASLSACAATAQLFPVVTPRNQAYELTAVFVFAGVLFLPAPALALLIAVAFLPEWVGGKKPWSLQLFNVANVLLDAFAARTLYLGVAGSLDGTLDGSSELLAALLGAVLFTLLNHLLLAIMLRLVRDYSWQDTLLFDMGFFLTDVMLACMGIFLVSIWQINPWMVSLLSAPLFFAYRGLKTPSLEAQARTDSKTQLYNSRHLHELLQEELRRAARFDRPLAVIMADMDLLRDVNNRYGHLAGDIVLKGVAGIIKRSLREYDLAARFGGEEFAIVLPEADLQQAVSVAERIREQVEAASFAIPTSLRPVRTTLSLGVAAFPVDGWGPEEILHQADLAVYYAKLQGRNQVCAASARSRALGPVMAERREWDTPKSAIAADPETAALSAIGEADQVLAADTRQPGSEAAVNENGLAEGSETPPAIGEDAGGARSGHGARSSDMSLQLSVYIGGVMAATLALWAIVRPWESQLDWFALAILVGLTAGAQSLALEIYDRGRISTSAIMIMAGSFLFGMPAALVLAPMVPLTVWVRSRGIVHRALFDLGDTTVSAAIAAAVYQGLRAYLNITEPILLFLPAGFAAAAYYAANVGLISIAIGLSERRSPLGVWEEKFRWLFIHYLVFGMLALFILLAYRALGLYGLFAFFIPPVMLRYVMKQYINNTERHAAELRRVNQDLVQAHEEMVSMLQELRTTYGATLKALSTALDSRDTETEGHSQRVVEYTEAIARQLRLPEQQISSLLNGALLHDVGKIGVPDAILRKPGSLDSQEWVVMRSHPQLGYGMLQHIGFLKDALPVVRHHHERYCGDGYPDGLREDEIPLEARIFAVADAFDAMTSDRPYRRAKTIAEARQEIARCSGSQFDPHVVEAFLQLDADKLARLSGCAAMPEKSSMDEARAKPSLAEPLVLAS